MSQEIKPRVTIALTVGGKRYTRTIPPAVLRSLAPEGWGAVAAARTLDLAREAGV